MRRSLCNCGLGALAVFVLLAPLALAASPIVHLVFGTRYGPAVLPFQVLLCAAAVDLALNPFSNFWHALNRPAMLSALNGVRLSLLVGAAMLAIPLWGSAGAAAAVLWGIIAGQAAAAGHRSESGQLPVDASLADPDRMEPVAPSEVHA
jgi:O-antigen/teichoic acid export membrane protein